jgi:hypothetical protein
VAEGVGVFLVRVAARRAVDAGPDRLREGVRGPVEAAGALEGFGKGPGPAVDTVERADRERPGGGSITGGVPKQIQDLGPDVC